MKITELKNKLQHLSQTEDVSDQYMTPHAEGFLLSPAVDLLISIQLYKHQELVWDQNEDSEEGSDSTAGNSLKLYTK